MRNNVFELCGVPDIVIGDFNVLRKNEEGKGRCESQLWSREIQNSIVLSII